MSTAVVTAPQQQQAQAGVPARVIEQVAIGGDLGALSPQERVGYYLRVCESLGLNPYTRPFEYIKLNGKLTLYARKDCTEQLRNKYGVSVLSLEGKTVDGVYVVTASVTDARGRKDFATGAVSVEGLKGEARANAFMKAETKAKRRATLSLCGLGMLDESEVLPDVQTYPAELPAPAEQAAPTNGNGQARELPKDGPELLKRLEAFDATGAQAGRWQAGELVRHVRVAGIDAGEPNDIAQWQGKAVEAAVATAKAFADQHPAQAQP